jgi:hypothetical protein
MSTGLVYHVTTNPCAGIERITISRDGGRKVVLPLPPGARIPEAGLDAVSPFSRAAEVILIHYLRTSTQAGVAAAETQAVEQRTLLSRLLSARLRDKVIATITSTDIERKLFPVLLGICHDRYQARYSVPRSSGDKTWTVSQTRAGEWQCSCPVWRFKRQECKHIVAVQDDPGTYPYIGRDR